MRRMMLMVVETVGRSRRMIMSLMECSTMKMRLMMMRGPQPSKKTSPWLYLINRWREEIIRVSNRNKRRKRTKRNRKGAACLGVSSNSKSSRIKLNNFKNKDKRIRI